MSELCHGSPKYPRPNPAIVGKLTCRAIDVFVHYDGKRATDIVASRFAVRQLVAQAVSYCRDVSVTMLTIRWMPSWHVDVAKLVMRRPPLLRSCSQSSMEQPKLARRKTRPNSLQQCRRTSLAALNFPLHLLENQAWKMVVPATRRTVSRVTLTFG